MITSLPVASEKVAVTKVEQIVERVTMRRVGAVMCSVLTCKCGELIRVTAAVDPENSFVHIDKLNHDIRQSGWIEDNLKKYDWCPVCKRTAKKLPVQRNARIPRFSVLDDAVFAMEEGMI